MITKHDVLEAKQNRFLVVALSVTILSIVAASIYASRDETRSDPVYWLVVGVIVVVCVACSVVFQLKYREVLREYYVQEFLDVL